MGTLELSREKKKDLYYSVIPVALKFRKTFLNYSEPIKDTFQTIEELGYFIVRFPAHHNLSGFHMKKGSFNCIFINSGHSLGRQFFSAWHECYHAYSGEGGGVSLIKESKQNEVEYKAECFAGIILMPEHLIKTYIQETKIRLKYIKYEELIIMQNYFRVSYSALITRLIQIFPEYQDTLSQRYVLGSQIKSKELIEKTEKVNGDLSLIRPTNNFFVSQTLYERIHENLKNNRISVEKADSILQMIEEFKKKYDS